MGDPRDLLFNRLKKFMSEDYRHGNAKGLKTPSIINDYSKTIEFLVMELPNNELLNRRHQNTKYDKMWNQFLDFIEIKLPSFYNQISKDLQNIKEDVQKVVETQQKQTKQQQDSTQQIMGVLLVLTQKVDNLAQIVEKQGQDILQLQHNRT